MSSTSPSLAGSGAGDAPRVGGDPEALLAGLDPEQREVALALRGPVRVLAGAGTGKTRALTHRIAYGVATGVYNPQQVLAVTFTVRAAGEMRSRLQRLGASGVQARTFHSAALRQARYFWPKVYGGPLPPVMDSKLPFVAGAARRNRLRIEQATLRDLASEIEWSKVSNVRPDDYPAVASARGREVSNLDARTVAAVFASYEEVKREADRIDLEDVLLCAAAILAEDERVAAEVRRQYHHFVVDEYQDVSPIQAALLDLWLGGRDDLCVVGDPAQTIYTFAGASSHHLLDLPRRYRGTTSIELVRNYRSTPEVVEGANRLLAGSGTRSVQLRAQRPSGPALQFHEHADEVEEAESTAAQIRSLVDAGTAPGEIAVLFRINAQSEAFEEALASRGVPYVVRGGDRFFARPEVRQAVTLLRGSARAAADRTESAATVVDAADAGVVGLVSDVLAGMGWARDAPTSRGNVRDRWESLQAIVDQAASFVAAAPGGPGSVTVSDFVADLDRRAAEQHAPAADGVTVATLHAAKGLEWDAVFLAGLVDGTLPYSASLDSPASVEEERRLLYVGMTRARRDLVMSWALARNPGGRASRKPSRFLDGLRPESPSDAVRAARGPSRGKAGKGKARSVCRVCGAALTSVAERRIGRHEGCESSYDEALFERLRAWRAETAKADSVPAYVVFTDLTLQAIAEVQPGSAQAMLAINGIGASKLEKYGDAVLTLVAGGTVTADDDQPTLD
ncbi:UvrD-helicase domain-containing protein [Nocardioides sp. HDW12B]|nr:UvrD-helicase domain-containing protein [Nocardioides sp. HDW12B]